MLPEFMPAGQVVSVTQECSAGRHISARGHSDTVAQAESAPGTFCTVDQSHRVHQTCIVDGATISTPAKANSIPTMPAPVSNLLTRGQVSLDDHFSLAPSDLLPPATEHSMPIPATPGAIS